MLDRFRAATVGVPNPALSVELERTGLLAWPSTFGRCYEHWPDVPAHFFRLGGSGDAFRHSATASPSRLSKTRHFCRAWETIFSKIFRPHDLGSGSRHAALPSRIIRIAEPPQVTR